MKEEISLQLDSVEATIVHIIDEHRGEIIEFARDIYDHGELGYKEFRTAKKFSSFLASFGIATQDGYAITGVKGYLNPEKREEISLALIGEFDALRIPNHKHYNKETGGVHACGHHAQLAGVIGAAIALSNPLVRKELDGQVVFFGVPAEEYGEIEYKNQLKEQGKIQYGGGKCELLRIGAFDDIDLSIVHHTGTDPITIGSGTDNGFVSKVIRYQGKSAHAAGSPQKGVNALNAAAIGLTALSYQRETFRDQDHVRIHPILTKGGDLVNVVPEEAVIETLVRASTVEAILDADRKTDRAFQAGAVATGAGLIIQTLPGYLPTLPSPANPNVRFAAEIASNGRYEIKEVDTKSHSGGSTDVGDLDHIQPVLKFGTGGIISNLHSVEFDIVDEELAYIVTAKIFALSAYHLLRNGAAEAKKIVKDFHPIFTKETYIEYMNSFLREDSIPRNELQELDDNIR